MEYGLELYHHGVKGQHWGKRNGPPYPLYRKSAYYKKTGQRPPGYTGNKKGKGDKGGPNTSGRVGGLNDSKSEKRKQLAKKIAIGAGTAAALAGAGYLAYRNRGRIAKDFRTIGTNAKTDYYKARGKIFNSKAYESVERRLNDPRIRLAKNRITSAMNRAKAAPGKLKNELTNPTSAFRNDARLVGASAKGMARNIGNKVKATAAKPGQTVYNKIAGKSKSALNAAKIESQYARNNSRTLKRFIDDSSQQIEKATIAKRKALAQIRRGEGNIKELNKAANNWAAKEKALIAKQNTAKALAPRAAADRISKAEAVRQAQEVFNKRNKLGRIAAGATNAGIGLGLAGAAGGAGYGISKLARSSKKKNQNRGTIGGIPKRLTASSTDSAVTRRAKQNYNTMSDAEFKRRFSVSKETYAKRVAKYGDPYMNSPLAKLGKRLSRRRRRR